MLLKLVYEIVIHLHRVVTIAQLKQTVCLVAVFTMYATCNDIPHTKPFVLLH